MVYLKACAFNNNDIYVKVNKIEGFFEFWLNFIWKKWGVNNTGVESQTQSIEKNCPHY